jgi:protein-disulfide isomerase
VAAGGAIWSGLVLLLAAWGMRKPESQDATRVAGYVFVMATVGLAAAFYFGYVSFFVLRSACPVCITMYVSIAGVFLLSAAAAGPLGALPSLMGKDLRGVWRTPVTAVLTALWLLASVGLVLAFPRENTASAASSEQAAPAVPLETLAPEQIAEWEQWLSAQTPLTVADLLPSGGTKVLVLKFNDFQCPSCRQAWLLYKDIVAKYESQHPGVFRFENRDFPLETECGAGNAGHLAACEAAAAVRMAREKNKERELEAALFNLQSPTMSRDDVKAALREVAQIDDFDARYAKVLEAVRLDVQLGQKVGVTGTPTFYLNGIRLPSLRPAYFDAALAWAVRKAGA